MINNISIDRIESYYNRFFKEDLERYFEIENVDGIPTLMNLWGVNSRCQNGEPTVRNPFLLLESISGDLQQHQQDSKHTTNTGLQDGYKIDDFTFSVMFASVVMMQEAIWSVKWGEPKITQEIISTTNYPIIRHIFIGESIEQIMTEASLWPNSDNEKELFLSIGEQVFPFIKKQMMPCILQWNNHALEERGEFISSPADHIAHEYDNLVFKLMRQMSKQHSLLDITLTRADIEQYYEKFFLRDLKAYFNVEHNREGYDMILCMDHIHCRRLVDGNPSDSGVHNMMFANILLYMIIAEKSISPFNETYKGLLPEFFRKTKWLLIYTGPGGGYQVSSMKMLEYAGLAPRPEESLIFLTVMKPVFEYMRSLLGQVFNASKKSNVGTSALQQFLSNGHIGKRMLKCLDAEIDQFKADLFKSVEAFLKDY